MAKWSECNHPKLVAVSNVNLMANNPGLKCTECKAEWSMYTISEQLQGEAPDNI